MSIILIRTHIITLLFTVIHLSVYSQENENYSDEFLSESFKVYNAADFEMAYHITPFLRERFISELRDSSSFYNPFDSLSRYVRIKYSSDSLVKTYSWDERNGSCCHTSATFAQFKTESGEINFVDLEKPEHNGIEIFIFDMQKIEFKDSSFYMILGWGTCCGGKFYEIARIYKIQGNDFVQIEKAFGNEKDLYIGANRGQETDLKYDPESKELTYNFYEMDEDSGFYKREITQRKWVLKKEGFKLVK
ncbi:MAG: hypothetical protein KDC84_16120 [Crocinitomicaceae bacterium]|nr:hypothetical protein [Crocinitomicaceae bacterium]